MMKIEITNARVFKLVEWVSGELTGYTTQQLAFVTSALLESFYKHIVAKDHFIGEYTDEEEWEEITQVLTYYLTDKAKPYLNIFVENNNGLITNFFTNSYVKKFTKDFSNSETRTVTSNGGNMSEISPINASATFDITTPYTKNKGNYVSNDLNTIRISGDDDEEFEEKNAKQKIDNTIKILELRKDIVSYMHSIFVFLIDEYNHVY